MMPHDHAPHDHAHHHAPKDFGPAFAIGIALNLGFVILETVYGLLAHSIALVADAGHNLGDVLGLAMAWSATILARRAPSRTHTYGLRRGTILAALANAVLLTLTVGAIAIEGLRRLIDPTPIDATTVMLVATAGIAINGATAWLFAAGGKSGRNSDINLRAAFTHMAGDALVSLGVVAGGALVLATGWSRIDPLISIAIAGLILAGTWTLLRQSVAMALDAVPVTIRPGDVRTYLATRPGVADIHDLHIWPISTTETALTCHCVMPKGHPGDEALASIAHDLHHQFNIGHTTIQIETSETGTCVLAPEHVV